MICKIIAWKYELTNSKMIRNNHEYQKQVTSLQPQQHKLQKVNNKNFLAVIEKKDEKPFILEVKTWEYQSTVLRFRLDGSLSV